MAAKDLDSRFPFTMKRLRDLPNAPAGVRKEYHDANTKGLSLRVTDSGVKTFTFYARVNGTMRRETIGRFPEVALEVAARRVAEIWGQVASGKDPFEEALKEQQDPTFRELFVWYMDIHGKSKKDGGKKDESQFRLYLEAFAKGKASEVTRGDVYGLHAQVANSAGPVAANRVLALVKSVYNVAIEREAFGITANPAAKVKMAKEESRKRRLELAEVPFFLVAINDDDDQDTRDFLEIALYTGARKSNVLAMRWDQLNQHRRSWLIPGEEFKNGEAHEVPLTERVQAILARRQERGGSPWVFPGNGRTGHMVEPKRGLERILKRAGINDFHFHDLRRTLATFMAEADIPENLIGLVLGHKPKSITGVYTRPSLDVLREAMERGIARMHQVAQKYQDS